MNAERVTYVDSSAIVKLVAREPQSGALRRFLRRRGPLVSSALARAEVVRAVRPLGSAAVKRAGDVLDRFELLRINDRVLTAAGHVQPDDVRTLDAIHLASAAAFDHELHRFVTYDERMARAAIVMGLTVAAPA